MSELRTKLTSAMELAKNGEQVFITERGKYIAVLGPVNPRMNNASPGYLTNTDLERTQARQRARDEILRGVNKKKS